MPKSGKKVSGDGLFLWGVLIVLAVLNYGWVLFPAVGEYGNRVTGGITLAIIVAGCGLKVWRHFFGSLPAVLLLLASHPALAGDPILPDPKLTPGAVLTTDVKAICTKGYSKTVRHTSGKLKAKIYREYGLSRKTGHYEIDHLIPLSIGGADEAANLWPESYDTQPWNASVKDRLELKLHRMVCGGRLHVREAQEAIARNWIDAYRRFCPSEADCPSYSSPKRE